MIKHSQKHYQSIVGINKQVTIKPKTIEQEIDVSIETTPKKETELFFETLEENIEDITESISPNIENRELIQKELRAFARYWTEPNSS